ncbi:MAG: HlyD family type I secretion periplasmic adaptor subunit [Burkholderiales bacterium]
MLGTAYTNISNTLRLWLNPPKVQIRRSEDPKDYFAEGREVARTGIVVIATALGGFGAWACTASLSGAVIVHGTVKVQSSRKTVQHLEGGIIKEILVKSGDRVKQGQALVVLDDVQQSASVRIFEGQLDAERAKHDRLVAEVEDLPDIKFGPELASRMQDENAAAVMRSEQEVFSARKRLLEGQVKLIRGQIREVETEIAAVAQQGRAAEKQIQYMRDQLAMNESLHEEKFISQVKLLDFKRQLAEKEESHGEHMARIAQARQKIGESELRIVALYDDRAQKAAGDLKESKAKIADVQDRIRPFQDQLRRSSIKAPITGEVVDIKVSTIGGVVTPGEALMDIVPARALLYVAARMPPEHIKHVTLGAEVDVQLAAYKQRITPRVPGKLTYISADAITDKNAPYNGGPSSYYELHIAVDKAALNAAGGLELTPGMPVEAFVRTQDRTMFEYILQPITDSLSRAFREN